MTTLQPVDYNKAVPCHTIVRSKYIPTWSTVHSLFPPWWRRFRPLLRRARFLPPLLWTRLLTTTPTSADQPLATLLTRLLWTWCVRYGFWEYFASTISFETSCSILENLHWNCNSTLTELFCSILQFSIECSYSPFSLLIKFPTDIPMRKMQGGGTVRTWDIPPEAERLSYYIRTNGRPLKALVELVRSFCNICSRPLSLVRRVKLYIQYALRKTRSNGWDDVKGIYFLVWFGNSETSKYVFQPETGFLD